ncbi:MAG: hypothetical protein HRT89_02370 [Lentisphaeria bacterium]|nr:hypothetical protein [Lentisphaeria bacterium]NQZ66893.1 hypothetical protein [Lentisphaeria bacterium]
MSKRNYPISRKGFIKTSAALSLSLPSVVYGAEDSTLPSGLIMVTSGNRIDLLSLKTGKIISTINDFFASHAVVPVEALNRFFIHGKFRKDKDGAVLVFQVDPKKETAKQIAKVVLKGGTPLHWQPNPEQTLIQYNCIGAKNLHVLDTKTLKLKTYAGGGVHSNMAFFNQNKWLLATDRLRGGTTLRIIDRDKNSVLSATAVGGWGHGITVNHKMQRAFVWANDGVHMVDLSEKNIGKHLGRIAPTKKGQRSWFCWTPQGGRYSHDQTWNWNDGDSFSDELTVIDTEKNELLKVASKGEALGTLAVSPDGVIGCAGSHNSKNVSIFDIKNNKYLGKIKAGKGGDGFFDRDIGFSKNRRFVFVTNPPQKTLSILDVKNLKEIKRIDLPGTPQWMKVLTV